MQLYHTIVAHAASTSAPAPRVQLARDGADDLAQPPLVGGVDVLVARLDLEHAALPLLSNLQRP